MLKSYSEHTYFVFEMTTPILQSLDYPNIYIYICSMSLVWELEHQQLYQSAPRVYNFSFSSFSLSRFYDYFNRKIAKWSNWNICSGSRSARRSGWRTTTWTTLRSRFLRSSLRPDSESWTRYPPLLPSAGEDLVLNVKCVTELFFEDPTWHLCPGSEHPGKEYIASLRTFLQC